MPGIAFLGLAAAASLVCLVHLLARPRVPWWRRLAWALVVLVPAIGPPLYLACFEGAPEPGGIDPAVPWSGGVTWCSPWRRNAL